VYHHYGIVRTPGHNFAEGLTSGGFGPPDLERALVQHRAYCEALETAGLNLIRLPADPSHPDGPFVEDTAVVVPETAVITRLGAPERRGEEVAVERVLESYRRIERIEAPAALDGGDVLRLGKHFYIGISQRTDEAGAKRLGSILTRYGYTWEPLEVLDGLHLKSSVSYLGDGILLASEQYANCREFRGMRPIVPASGESYAANAVRVNGVVLVAAGFPGLARSLRNQGVHLLELDVSEFRRMDGGLSCLSVLF
jgi:dimethylargininase